MRDLQRLKGVYPPQRGVVSRDRKRNIGIGTGQEGLVERYSLRKEPLMPLVITQHLELKHGIEHTMQPRSFSTPARYSLVHHS